MNASTGVEGSLRQSWGAVTGGVGDASRGAGTGVNCVCELEEETIHHSMSNIHENIFG